MEVIEKKLRLAAPLYRRDFIKKILFYPLTEEIIEEGSIYSEMRLDSEVYTVFVFKLDNVKIANSTEKNWKLIILGLEKVLTEICESNGSGYIYVDPSSGNSYILVTDKELQKDISGLKCYVDRIRESIYSLRGLLRTTVSCGIGMTQHDAKKIYISARQAESILVTAKTDAQVVICEQGKMPEQLVADMGSDLEPDIEPDMEGKDNPAFKKSDMVQVESQRYIIKNVLEYVDKNYMKPISLSSAARQVYVSPVYLSYLFKQVTGINFIHYLTKKRVEYAKKMLKDPKYKVSEIGEAVGYENPRYFADVFKKYAGTTPYGYRSGLEVKP